MSTWRTVRCLGRLCSIHKISTRDNSFVVASSTLVSDSGIFNCNLLTSRLSGRVVVAVTMER